MKKTAVYKCGKCGDIVESLWDSVQTLTCCGEDMKELVPNSVEASKEKHIPVVERQGSKVTVKVGSVAHPMTKEHYILFVELIAGDTVLRHDFKEGDTAAEAVFYVEEHVPVIAREYCNLHGFWTTK
jgi:superoxide reductase